MARGVDVTNIEKLTFVAVRNIAGPKINPISPRYNALGQHHRRNVRAGQIVSCLSLHTYARCVPTRQSARVYYALKYLSHDSDTSYIYHTDYNLHYRCI